MKHISCVSQNICSVQCLALRRNKTSCARISPDARPTPTPLFVSSVRPGKNFLTRDLKSRESSEAHVSGIASNGRYETPLASS